MQRVNGLSWLAVPRPRHLTIHTPSRKSPAMLRYAPLVLALAAIGAAAVYEGVLNHRWTPNRAAERCAKMLSQVPEDIGPWKGKSYEVDEEILRVAGAEGYVSRLYVNEETEQSVKVWLIVGPFKHVFRHTPNICYPSQDFKPRVPTSSYSFDVESVQNQFLTSEFAKQRHGERVFWSWCNPDNLDELVWYGGGKRETRELYAGTQALFKLYFTTTTPPGMQNPPEPEESAANDFAKVFLPMLTDMIHSEVSGVSTPPAAAPPADDA